MQKKIITYFAIILVVFCAGFFTSRIGSNRDIKDLENRTAELESENIRISEELGNATDKAGILAIELQNATGTIDRLNSELSTITNGLSDIRQGLSEAGSGISGVIKGIDFYLGKAENQE